jgi:hypothetical protein
MRWLGIMSTESNSTQLNTVNVLSESACVAGELCVVALDICARLRLVLRLQPSSMRLGLTESSKESLGGGTAEVTQSSVTCQYLMGRGVDLVTRSTSKSGVVG